MSHAERLAERRAAFLAAGTDLFAASGFRGATVRAVCQAAQLNDRYFYALFGGMEDLLLAVYGHWSGQLGRELVQALAGEAPLADRLDAMLHAFFRFMRNAPVARILLLEVAGVSPAVDEAYKRHLADFARMLSQAVAWPPAVERADQRIVSIALVGAVTTAAIHWHLSGYRASEARMVQNCRLVLLGALQNLGQAGAPRR